MNKDIYDEILHVVQDTQTKQVQENAVPLLIETANLLRQIVLVQQEMLIGYEQDLPQALIALLKDRTLTAEQAKACNACKEFLLQKRPGLWDELNELMQQAAAKYQEVLYLQAIASHKAI